MIPQVNAIQAQVTGPVSRCAATDPRRVEFDRLHGLSNILFSITAIGGLALCLWEAGNERSRISDFGFRI